MPILYDEFGIESAILGRAASSTAASSRDDVPSPRRRRRRRVQARNPARVLPVERGRDAALPYPRRVRPTRLAVGARLRRRVAEGSLEPVRAAMEAAGAAEVGPCPVTATVSAAFTTGRRTISLRCERACTYRARLLRLPRRNAVTVVTGRAAAKRRAQVQLEPAEVTPGWYQLGLVRRRSAARTAGRARQHAVLAGLLAAALLAGCGGTTPGSPHVSGWSRRRRRTARGPVRAAAGAASAPSGSRASGSRVSRRRPRRRLPSSRRRRARRRHADFPAAGLPWFIHDAADGRGASPVRRNVTAIMRDAPEIRDGSSATSPT